jgi:hypothetical protein
MALIPGSLQLLLPLNWLCTSLNQQLERMAVQGGDFRKVGHRSRGALTSAGLRGLLADDIRNLAQRAATGDVQGQEVCLYFHKCLCDSPSSIT